MSDLEKFVELYKSLGISVIVNTDDKGYKNIIIGESDYEDGLSTISPLFDGYLGFYSAIEFNEEGRFVRQGFYE